MAFLKYSISIFPYLSTGIYSKSYPSLANSLAHISTLACSILDIRKCPFLCFLITLVKAILLASPPPVVKTKFLKSSPSLSFKIFFFSSKYLLNFKDKL